MPNEDEIILTPDGVAKLEQELEELKTAGRRELAERIKIALSYGDLKENSEYHSAKDDQAFMETRILTITNILRKAKVVENQGTDVVAIGSIAVLNDLEFDERIEYQIVGPAEADVAGNKISYESPLGKALLGHKVGDVVEVEAPIGIIKYEVLDIKQGL
ncbi:transcription elongation factor GreA [Paenibacillus yonginensis]|uniref:Transcription elongation factor GreA n=1 Tax=Paenibacillus yonginensis TaxID=1462996 RepID=A0A1B1N5C1_9BACL|nr:transcription elongation factor GreA [Paenibacillus yonginensis]ANS76619.1 transcription elongation factor GreA [Paenibacillus yonginensis]